MKNQTIENLLDAAFSVLQHDTGPTDLEYVHQRETLRQRFKAVYAEGLREGAQGIAVKNPERSEDS